LVIIRINDAEWEFLAECFNHFSGYGNSTNFVDNPSSCRRILSKFFTGKKSFDFGADSDQDPDPDSGIFDKTFTTLRPPSNSYCDDTVTVCQN